jgi:hypothetical protein
LETPLFSMGKKQRLTTKKGKKVSPNVSVKTRVNAALADFKKGKQGNTKESISRRHGVAVSRLNRYIKHYKIQKGDASTACYELLSRGRPNKVKNIVTIMDKPVKIAKASIKSRHTQKMFTKEAKKLLQQSQIKALAPVPNYSKSTWTRAYISSYGAEKIKCSESYSWSFDDVAVTVNPSTQKLQIVRITKEERARLNKWHLTPGAMPDPDRETEASNVVYKMFNSVNAAGFRGPLITKMLDHDFKWDGNEDQWMAIYRINNEMALYVACVNRNHPKYCEIEYFENIFIKVIIPFVKEYRDLHSTRGKPAVVQMHSQESMSPDGVRSTEIVFDVNGDRILITADGYYPGIEAIIRKVGAIMNENGIEAFKWAGGCSLVEQPADVADSHANIHKAAASDTFRDDEDGAPTDRVRDFIDFLPKLGSKGARLHTHQKFLRHLEWMVDKAWTKRGITEGWRISGMWPYDASRILHGWGGWEHIETEVAGKIIALCTDLDGEAFHSIARHKYLQDEKAQEIFGHLIEDEDFKSFMSDKISTTAPTNMRSLMLTTKAFDDDCSYMQRLWELRSAAAARLLAARGEVLNGVQMCICGAKLPKCVGSHLNTQAHKTNVRKKGIEDVPDEPVLAAGEGGRGVVPLSLPAASRHVPRSRDAHPSRLSLQFEEEEMFEQEELPMSPAQDCSSAA